MGVVKLSQKVKRPPVVGSRYWAERDMYDFMPSVAYDVPFVGALSEKDEVVVKLRNRIADLECDLNPFDQVGVHIEVYDHGYLTITIGVFAT